MSAVERRGAPGSDWENGPPRSQDFERHRRLASRPGRLPGAGTGPPDGSRSARRAAHGRPIYVSFVTKAILWDRGLSHYTNHDRPIHRPLLCPRFFSHMKACRPKDVRPPCFLSSKSRPQPPSQGKMLNAHTLPAPKRQTLEGLFHVRRGRGGKLTQNDGLITGRRSAAAAVVPCPPLPATPPSSSVNLTLPPQSALRPDSGGQQSKPNAVPPSPSNLHPEEREPQLAAVSVAESDCRPHPGLAGPERSPSPASVVSHGSLSDLSRPPSSLFSSSTTLASGRISVLSANTGDSDSEGGACLSPLQPCLGTQSPLASYPPAGSNPRRSASNVTTTPELHEPPNGQTKLLSPRLTSGIRPQSDKPLSRPESSKTTENPLQGDPVDPGLNPSMDSEQGPITLTFPSATWSTCPSPQRATPRPGSGPKLTPPASVTRLESHRWPVLPPISPVRGHCGSAASRHSELSCSESRVFDELEAIAPRSASCPSLDEPSDSSRSPSPHTELSPGLAALTVGCDSGNLGSLSRVQLLLLDRLEPETPRSPFDQEGQLSPAQDWSDLTMQYNPGLTSAGALRPLTAGSITERCNSAGKVRRNKSRQSERCSGSPWSWIIDPSPSCDMFGSAHSPCSRANEGGPATEESNYPRWTDEAESSAGGGRSGGFHHSTEEKDRRMEERKTKALKMLSKLQEDTPHQPNANEGHSNFEDFDFLAKYCIFSQERLAEYKRAFEAEDSNGDGYISCLQVLLALKNIIPPELLSDEEEIYVYRILEMVDFKVTDGLVDLRLFAVISSLAQKIATMDEFMRSLISDMDFRSLEVRLFKAKQLFLFLLDEQHGDTGAQQGSIGSEQLLLELKAGGIHLQQEAAVRLELQRMPPLDLLGFLAYLPLFMLIHKSVISNPLDDYGDL